MAAKQWRPTPLRTERNDRKVRSMFPTAGDGVMGTSSPITSRPSSERARRQGTDFDKEYSQVWEQDTEPEEAAVHDFWWDPTA